VAANVHWLSMKPTAQKLSSEHRPTGILRFRVGSKASLSNMSRDLGARMVTTLYRRMLFLAYPLTDPSIPVYRASIDVRFAQLGAADIAAYLRFRPDSDWRTIESRMARGDRCFAAWIKDEIVDACWMATGSVFVPYLGRRLQMEKRDIYSYDSYTLPKYRAHGVYMARNSYTARMNQSEGFTRSIALVAVENYTAWLVLTRSGLRTLGAYHYVRIPGAGIRWKTTEPGCDIPDLLPAQLGRERQTQSLGAMTQ
jgi:hypothetical protein